MSDLNTWEKVTLKKISKLDQITDLGKKAQSLKPWEHTNVEVWNFSPNERLDKDDKAKFKLIGPEWSIIQQSSMVKAIHDMLGKRLGYLLSFEEFFEQWEGGFTDYPVRNGRIQSNFPRDPIREGQTTIPSWRSDKDTRPYYVEWKKNESKGTPKVKKVRVIEYWRDKSKPKESVVLVGSDSEIIRHILQMEYEGGGAAGGDSKNIRENVSILVGQPMVKLYFKQLEGGDYKRPLEADYSFRLMGWTDDPEKVNPRIELLTPADLKNLAQKIKSIFWPNGDLASRFSYEKGKKSATYRDIQNGYKLWLLVKSEIDAENLVKKFLSVQDIPYKESKLVISQAKNPVNAYPDTAPEVITLGETRKRSLVRPEAKMSFWRATIQLSLWPQSITLLNYDGTLFEPEWLKRISA